MPPIGSRVAGVVLGIVLGLVAGRVADALPKRYGIAHLATGRRRTRRNGLLVASVGAAGAGIGEMIARADGVEAWHATLLLLVHALVVAAVLAAAAIDLEHMILPDELTLGAAVLCLASSPIRNVGFTGAVAGAITGGVVAYLPMFLYSRLRKRSGMGLGDAKLIVLAGAWFGALGVFLVLFAATVLVLLAAIAARVTGLRFAVPESVVAEIASLRERAAAGDQGAKAELAADPMAADVEDGALETRLPFGPCLAIGSVALLFTRRWLEPFVLSWLFR